jgi:diaminopimelate epimerase
MSELPFTKMHGLGNDFVVVDSLNPDTPAKLNLTPQRARQICDRRFGIGADQILWLKKAKDGVSDARMEILNADGSTAEMCGNGIRAVGLYLSRGSKEKKTDYAIETLSGVQKVKVQSESVVVDMGTPKLGAGFPDKGELLRIQDRELYYYDVNVGNPHAIFFVEDVDRFPVEEVGALVETHRRFPNRTNVEFVEVRSEKAIKVRVWERGAGITLACGSGACAAAVASIALKKTLSSIEVQLPGGKLLLTWKGEGSSILMEGPAEEVFRGVYHLR